MMVMYLGIIQYLGLVLGAGSVSEAEYKAELAF